MRMPPRARSSSRSSPAVTGAGASSTRPSSDRPVSAEPAPLAETPDLNGAFPHLSEDQVGMLAQHGQRRRIQRDEVLVREGDRDYDFFVILDGRVAVVSGYGSED